MSTPKLNMRLSVSRLCFLNDGPGCNLVVYLTLENKTPISFIRDDPHDKNGLKQILTSQCIECIDDDDGQSISIFSSEESSLQRTSGAGCPNFMTLEPKRTSYISFTTSTKPREYEFLLNTRELKVNRKYTIQCKPTSLEWWSLRNSEDLAAYFHENGKFPQSDGPPLRCVPSNDTVSFTTQSEMARAPEVSVSLSAPAPVVLSGSLKYEFSLTFTSHAKNAITVLADRDSATAGDRDVEILESTTSKRVAPDLLDINEDGPWQREDFLRLEPGQPYVEHRAFDLKDCCGDQYPLDVGKEYVLRMLENEWFWWSEDDVDTVMGYAGERDSGGLGPSHPIKLGCDNEVKFHVLPKVPIHAT